MNIYDNVKNRKPFYFYDLIIYTATLILVVGLFLGFVVFNSPENSDGFKIIVNEKEALVFYYESGAYEIKETGEAVSFTIDKAEDGIYFISVFYKDLNEHNIISVNTEEKKVKVSDADCSIRKDCVHTKEIEGDSGAIYCMPHKLKILPLKNGYRPISTGGL